MKKSNTAKTVVTAALVALVIGSSVVLGRVFFDKISVHTNVTEPISFPTTTLNVNVPVGGSVDAVIEVDNAGIVPIPISFDSSVVSVPQGGSTSDLTVTAPNDFSAAPGHSTTKVTLTASTSAVVGSYEVEITPSR